LNAKRRFLFVSVAVGLPAKCKKMIISLRTPKFGITSSPFKVALRLWFFISDHGVCDTCPYV